MTHRPEPQDAFAADEQLAYEAELEGYGEDGDYADYDEYLDGLDLDDEDFEDDGQPDEQQEWDDLYGYGPEFDSYDGYDEY